MILNWNINMEISETVNVWLKKRKNVSVCQDPALLALCNGNLQLWGQRGKISTFGIDHISISQKKENSLMADIKLYALK